MTGRTKQYVVKLTEDEHAELKQRADAQGVSLAQAFREGAKSYLSSTPEARATYASAATAAEELIGSVEQARSVLKSLTKE